MADKAKAGLIYEKVAKIIKEIDPIKKERKNTQQGYSFRGIEDAMNMLSPLMAKHSVFPTSAEIVDVRNDDVQSKQGTGGYHYVRRYTFRFYAEDGSFVDTVADGEAIDYGDKASNKAYSTAYREALWKMFVVPFDVDDTENYDHAIEPNKQNKKEVRIDANNPALIAYKKQLQAAGTLRELQKAWADVPPQAKSALMSIKDEMKAIIQSETVVSSPETYNEAEPI